MKEMSYFPLQNWFRKGTNRKEKEAGTFYLVEK